MITPAPVFQDHAVLQRGIPVPVWGWGGTPGETLCAELAESVASTTVNQDGSWILRLPALNAGGPFELILRSGSETVRFTDLLLGDVWVCSGQSNMSFTLHQADEAGAQSRGVMLPHIRLLRVDTPAKADPQSAIRSTWKPGTPENLAAFSAVAGWFGRTLHASLEVPIGLIENAWGGTRIQAWLSREALMTDPTGREEVAEYESRLYNPPAPGEGCFRSVEAWFRSEGPEDPVNRGCEAGWHLADFDHDSWGRMPIPGNWQSAGFQHSGIFWFRRRVPLPSSWRGKPLALHLGAADKHDDTYVNGQRVGGLSWETPDAWCTPREYEIPATCTQDCRELLIAVRVRSHQYHGGLIGPASALKIFPVGQEDLAVPLTGDWHFAIEQNWGQVVLPSYLDPTGSGPGGCNAPFTLFHSRLKPVIPYGIRGWIWYQGESNTAEAELYRRLLPLLIRDWRRIWGQGDLPFIQVQLANFGSPCRVEGRSHWAELREAQAAALRLPGVGMAVSIDVGEAEDIHPKNKKAVGERLARWALVEVYGQDGVASGPILCGMSPVAGGRLRLHFHHAEGLHTRDGDSVRWLEIAGRNRRFLPAHSRIEGTQLEVWHPEIPAPVAVRYAWADNPEGCNLVNAEDLPASPFHTDEP